MVDYFIGLLLLGLGINKTVYAPNPDVKGDETVVSQEDADQESGEDEPEEDDSLTPDGTRFPPKTPESNVFLLRAENFEEDGESVPKDRVASRTGIKKRIFDSRAFGTGILRMQGNFSEAVETSREEAKQEFEARKQAFKEQLEIIKDARKKIIVEKLSEQCQGVNTKRTEKMTEILLKLSVILTNVSNRSSTLADEGKDTSAVDTAVATAQKAIASAQEAVVAQAGELCTITVSTEKNLKTDVGKVISGLQQNLNNVHEKVIAARKSVGDAIKALAKLSGESLEREVKTKITVTPTESL